MDTETLDELLRSPKFLSWRPPLPLSHLVLGTERHYTIKEIAEQWGVSSDLVRDAFKDEDGVLIFERPSTRTKRAYSTMRIPESVLERVHSRLSKR